MSATKAKAERKKISPKFQVENSVENEYAGSGMPVCLPGKIVEVCKVTARGCPAEFRYRVQFCDKREGWLDEDMLTRAEIER